MQSSGCDFERYRPVRSALRIDFMFGRPVEIKVIAFKPGMRRVRKPRRTAS